METKVGIITPTMNRPQFVIRQLHYYARVNCPHTIYIGDSSDEDAAKKIRNTIEELKNKISVIYFSYPKMGGVPCIRELMKNVKENYIALVGDDDFLVPRALTKCVEFLKTHPDYATAHGYAVTFKTINDSAVGQISKIKDYHRAEVESESASQRISDFLKNYYVTLFSVHYTDKLIKNWEISKNTYDSHFSFSSEITPGCLDIIDGKSKLLDCLGLVRQMHEQRLALQNTFDLITHDSWQPEYKIFLDLVGQKLSEKDKIPLDEAKSIVSHSYWFYLQYWLDKDYAAYGVSQSRDKPKENYRAMAYRTLPFLRKPYRKIKQLILKKRWIHAEAQNPKSPYYNDFQEIVKIINNG